MDVGLFGPQNVQTVCQAYVDKLLSHDQLIRTCGDSSLRSAVDFGMHFGLNLPPVLAEYPGTPAKIDGL